MENEFKRWLNDPKVSELLKKKKTSVDLHCSLSHYSDVALRLQFLQNEKNIEKGRIVEKL